MLGTPNLAPALATLIPFVPFLNAAGTIRFEHRASLCSLSPLLGLNSEVMGPSDLRNMLHLLSILPRGMQLIPKKFLCGFLCYHCLTDALGKLRHDFDAKSA